MTARISISDYHEKIAALCPDLRARAGEAERSRRLSQQTIDELNAAGLLRAYQPARYGGPELHMAETFPMAAQVARACPATSWVMAILQMHIWLLGLYPQQAQVSLLDSGFCRDDERRVDGRIQ